MQLLSKVGTYRFLVEPFHCDFSHRLFLGHLGNHLLNAADFHSNDRGYGMNYLNPIHRTWVLSRLVIEMQQMPRAYDSIDVDTWVEGVMRYFTSRNFAVRTADGTLCGYGRSIWAMIDTDSRQPVDILSVHDGLITEYVDTDTPCPIAPFSRARVKPTEQPVRTIETQYSDIDVNGHVNSVKYIDHILDLWPVEWYRSHRLERLEIAYMAESHQGDRLSFVRQAAGEDEYDVFVMKSQTDGTNACEVCRSKVKFMKE